MTINADVWLHKFRAQTDRHLRDMRAVLHALKDKSYAEKTSSGVERSVIDVKLQSQPDLDDIRNHQTNKCVQSSVTCLFELIEWLIAIHDIHKEGGVHLTRELHNEREALEYIEEYIGQRSMKMATDIKLKADYKLDFFRVDLEVREMAGGYVDLRNCIEHHRGIAQKDIIVMYRKFTFVIGGTDVLALPHKAEEGQDIGIRIDNVKKQIARGDKVILSEEEAQAIVLTMQTVLGPGYVLAMRDALKGQPST